MNIWGVGKYNNFWKRNFAKSKERFAFGYMMVHRVCFVVSTLLLLLLLLLLLSLCRFLKNLLKQTIVDHNWWNLNWDATCSSHRSRCWLEWLAIFMLKHAVQLATSATILPVAGRLASFSLDLHVTQRTLAVEARLVNPKLAGLFMAEGGWFVPKITVQLQFKAPW